MNKNHEKLLVAALAGVIIAGAAMFAVQPAMAAGYDVDSAAHVSGIEGWDVLNVRLWPASYSAKTGELEADSSVWVARCIEFSATSDWCLIEQGNQQGWVNSSYLELLPDADI